MVLLQFTRNKIGIARSWKKGHLRFHGKQIRPSTNPENSLYHPQGLKEKSQDFSIFYDVTSPLKSKLIMYFLTFLSVEIVQDLAGRI